MCWKLSSAILALIQERDSQSALLLFSGSQAALSCKQYVLSLAHVRDPTLQAHSIQVYSVEFRTSLCRDHSPSGPVLYAVLYPSELSRETSAFWQRAGPGISSRLAQKCLKYGLQPRAHAFTAPRDNIIARLSGDSHPVYEEIRSRIAGYVCLLYTSPSPRD